MNIEYSETGDIRETHSLWKKLIEHHAALSPYFSERIAKRTTAQRQSHFLEKSANGKARIDLAKDTETGGLVGYCVSSVSQKGEGEIDSIFIEESYRGLGIGDVLMKKALDWMANQGATRNTIAVAVGNEEVLAFYQRHGFYPRAVILEQLNDEKKNGSKPI